MRTFLALLLLGSLSYSSAAQAEYVERGIRSYSQQADRTVLRHVQVRESTDGSLIGDRFARLEQVQGKWTWVKVMETGDLVPNSPRIDGFLLVGSDHLLVRSSDVAASVMGPAPKRWLSLMNLLGDVLDQVELPALSGCAESLEALKPEQGPINYALNLEPSGRIWLSLFDSKCSGVTMTVSVTGGKLAVSADAKYTPGRPLFPDLVRVKRTVRGVESDYFEMPLSQDKKLIRHVDGGPTYFVERASNTVGAAAGSVMDDWWNRASFQSLTATSVKANSTAIVELDSSLATVRVLTARGNGQVETLASYPARDLGWIQGFYGLPGGEYFLAMPYAPRSGSDEPIVLKP